MTDLERKPNKEAIEILKELWRYEVTDYTTEEIREALDLAIEALERKNYKSESRRWKRRYLDLKQRIFKLEEQTRWIPVSERLPGEDGEYLVSIEENTTYKIIVDIAHWLKIKKSNNGFCKANEVFAWMPLPEPYGGESE